MHVQPLLLSHPALYAGRLSGPREANAAPPAVPAVRTPGQTSADSLQLSDEARQFLDLSEDEQAQVARLKQRDQEVRTHEQAHLAAAGPHARGGATYEYQSGPDGQRYAIGGEVQIDTSPVEGDPAATIRKAQQVRAAALAPAEPSAQDRAVAGAASKMEAEAVKELQTQQQSMNRPSPTSSGAVSQTPHDAEIVQAYQRANIASRFAIYA